MIDHITLQPHTHCRVIFCRYEKAHTGMIIIVTPDGDKALTSGETGVLRIPFHQFVKESKTLLGVKLRHTEVQSLSNKLKRKLFWN